MCPSVPGSTRSEAAATLEAWFAKFEAKKNGHPGSPLDVGMFNLGCCVGSDRDESKSSSKVGDLLRVQYFDLLSVLLCFF